MMTQKQIKRILQDNNLTLEERKYFEEILKELSSDGSSETLASLWSADYDEIPVDILTFITDPEYLGGSLVGPDGDSLIYPYWIKTLEKIFAPDSQVMEVALSGAIGIGKSTIASVGMAYILYRLLCLKNPAQYYRLVEGSRVAVAIFNINLDQSYGVGYQKLQDFCLNSPWFLRNGKVVGREYPTYIPDKNIDIVVGSKKEHFLGRDVFCGFMDEMEFAPGANVNLEKSKVMNLYTTIKRRMESRFQQMGTLPGMLFLVSSKNSEDDFLERYITKYKHSKHLYVVDEPLWVVKGGDSGRYSGETFKFAIGTRNTPHHILEDHEDEDTYIDRGHQVIDIPIEHKSAFELDANSALPDIAGIAVKSTSKFMVANKVYESYKPYLSNPFISEIVSLGFDDDSQLKDYLDESKLPKLNRDLPHFIHWDASKSGDRTGLGMTTIAGSREVNRLLKGSGTVGKVEDVVHKVIFGVAIEAVPGEEIPFYKIREFIYYLTKIGFNIVDISCDSYQSVDTIQQFKLQGYNARELSVDRTTKPYITMKNAYNEGRVIAPRIGLLETELLDLEDDRVRGKIDHPEHGSKDVADTISACIYKAANYEDSYDEIIDEHPTAELVHGTSQDNLSADAEELLDGLI